MLGSFFSEMGKKKRKKKQKYPVADFCKKPCDGYLNAKVRYPTPMIARRSAIALRKLYNDQTLQDFFCEKCHVWHVGHPPNRIR